MNTQRYLDILAELDLLLTYARATDVALAGRKPPSERHGYAAEIFIKLLAHCATLRDLAPDISTPGKQQLWDLGSLSAIARCVIETYDSLAYVSALSASDEERGFRLLLWSLHDSNRRMEMLQCVGTFDVRYHDLAAKEQHLHVKVVAHPHFSRIGKGHQKRILQREPPESYLSIKERCTASNINHDYYKAATMQLSQFVHTFPFAVHQLFAFKAGSAEALHMMALPLQYAMAFLSKATSDLTALFPEEVPKPPTDTGRKIELWCLLLKRGTKVAAQSFARADPTG